MDQYDKALSYYKRAYDINREIGRKNVEMFDLFYLGCAYRNMKEYDKALSHLKQALVLQDKIGDKRCLALILKQIGSTYYDLNQYESALIYYKRAINVSREMIPDKFLIYERKIFRS